MPDFGYWSWPLDLVGEYNQIRQEIFYTENDFFNKSRKVVWRGAVKTNKHRQNLLRVTAGKEWADVQAIRWASASKLKTQDLGNALSMADHCQYQFVLQTEGHSYSGRGKYLQNCNSVVIIPKRTWIEPHHSLLIASGPQQNFVEIEEDFSDLEEKVEFLLEHPEEAYRIAQNGIMTFRDQALTPAAQVCYWRQLIRGWAEVSFAPELWEIVSGSTSKKTRGIPFETFV